MTTIRRALAWALLLVLVAPLAAQARVADQAALLSRDTIRQLDEADQKMQQTYGRGLLVVSVDDLNGRRWEDVAKQYPTSSDKGVYVFLVKNQKVLRVMQPRGAGIPTSQLDTIRNTILGGIRGGGFDKGLLAGVPVIEDTYRSMGWSASPATAPQRKSGGGINWMFILIVGVGVFFLFKMIGATRNRAAGYQAPGYGQPGQPGYGQPGYGPGYQAPGGGGFMSGLLGGLGGAVAGNFLYDQFRGHGGGGGAGTGHDVGGSYTQSDGGAPGGDYDYSGSSGGSWQDSGGAEADFGGGAGGGADWGGGGGDFGGGGGDW